MKKVVVLLFCFVFLLFNSLTAMAYEYPSEFWQVDSKYMDALNKKDYYGIIKYGLETVNIANSLSGEKNTAMIAVRYNEVAMAYAKLGDYNKAKYYNQVLYDYTSGFGDTYYEYKKAAETRILQYGSEMKMYTDNGAYTYFGAKNELKNGVLFGICSGGETRSKLNNESLVLTYQGLGEELLGHNIVVLRNAVGQGYAVEFALNCPKEGNDIRNIYNLDSYLKEISDLLAKYPDVPVYLRFAAEFDVWTIPTTPEEFIPAYRYVADYFHRRNPNVAMVWSVNHASGWYVDIDDYYPGDEYVDWIGISLYSQKYFNGDKNASEINEIAFKTGINSNPVIAVKDIVETYGDRKPIMIAESGCGHEIVFTGEDTTEFALKRLKEHYAYLPMVYPQIKVIAYFDHYVVANYSKNDYRLSSNRQLQDEYLQLTKGQRFVQDSYENSVSFCYRMISDGISVESVFPVSCFAYKYGADVQSVTYFIDGKYVGIAVEAPFTAMVDASDYTGRRKLKAVALFGDGQTLVTESDIYINSAPDDITVEISGEKVYFDQQPLLYNNRTMVPMRKIFEELGATVAWDNNTKTVTGKKGDRTVKVTVGQNKMYVNNKEYTLDTAPVVVSGRTLVPVRAIAEGLGCKVKWDENKSLVKITPPVRNWSSWSEVMPDYVDDDMYYIEERTEYKYRTKEYFQSRYGSTDAINYVKTDVSYGSWSSWQNERIEPVGGKLEVETRRISNPVRYHYAHWCTGNLSDSSKRYRTSSGKWCDEAIYHDLGWFDYPLAYSQDSTDDYAYVVDGKVQRCSNSCYRWYLVDTSGGDYTQYRSREVIQTHTFWEWSDWSDYSTNNPYKSYSSYEIEVKNRKMYRYKEK